MVHADLTIKLEVHHTRWKKKIVTHTHLLALPHKHTCIHPNKEAALFHQGVADQSFGWQAEVLPVCVYLCVSIWRGVVHSPCVKIDFYLKLLHFYYKRGEQSLEVTKHSLFGLS